MATGPTGYTFIDASGNLVDFYDVFEPRNDGSTGPTTGFISKGNGNTDLGNLFKVYDSGPIITGYKNSSDKDLGSLFLPKLPFTAFGATTFNVTTSATLNYCYAIFTDTTANSKTITIRTTRTSGTLYIICVGGGGAGGNGQAGVSCGGGGGGGVDYKEVSFSNLQSGMISGTKLNVDVGAGGIANQVVGKESKVYLNANFYASSSGGTNGANDSKGFGGGYRGNNASTNPFISNGGDGSDGSQELKGDDWGGVLLPNDTIGSIPVPSALTGIIEPGYSGGGAGGKTSSLAGIYGGGGGGTGIGGPRPALNWYSYTGQAGLAYGGGGGGGGWRSNEISGSRIGGNGANGVVIVYATLI